MKREMFAIIKKDFQRITSSGRMFLTLLAVPFVLTVFVPSIFMLITYFAPEQNADFQKMLELMPADYKSENLQETMARVLFQYILPVFFLIIPVMAASIMSATSFVGEKEKRTLETLLYCPLTLKEIFQAKVLASFLLSMTVSFISFAAMLAVFETELYVTAGMFLIPDIKWLVIMLLVSPSLSLTAVTLIVRMSAKSQSVEDAQQGAVFLLLPILLLLAGQFAGVLLISTWILLGIGCGCAILAMVLLQKALGNFQYEILLK